MKLLIVEPDATGHHMSLYVRLVVRAALARGINISLLTKKASTSHPSFRLVMEEAQGSLNVHYMPDFPRFVSNTSFILLFNQLISYLEIWWGFHRGVPRDGYENILVINLDCFEKVLSFLGSPFGDVSFSGLLMSISLHRYKLNIGPKSRFDWLYNNLFRRLIRIKSLKNLAVIDEAFYTMIANSQVPCERKIKLLNDPVRLIDVIDRHSARRLLGIPPEKFVILVYGNITKRKGLVELISAISGIAAKNFFILIAGEIDREIQALKHTDEFRRLFDNDQIVFSHGFHDDDREKSVFGAADAVWVAYCRGFYGSSGVVYQAGAAKLPVIGSTYGLIGWTIQKYSIGFCCDPDNTNDVIDVLMKLYKDEQLRSELGNSGFALACKHKDTDFAFSLLDFFTMSSSDKGSVY
jgi:glycosyltransferase involved in cell wall biosynthesis